MRAHRPLLAAVLIFVLGAIALPAQIASDIFTAMSIRGSGDAIILQWTTLREEGVTSFEVQRRGPESPVFVRIGTVELKGSGNRYTYVDNSAFNKATERKEYSYRIKGITRTGNIYSQLMTINHEVSSVRKSWGMIKELFR